MCRFFWGLNYRLFSYWSYIIIGGTLLIREGLKLDFEKTKVS